MIHGSVKIFLPLLLAIVLFSVLDIFAEPVLNTELSQSVGRKKDEPKNPISKFLLHSKEKIQQSIKKLKKIKDEDDDPFSTELGNDTIDTLQFSSDLQFVNVSDEKSAGRTDVPKVNHAPELINRISGDSLKSLGMGTPVYCALAVSFYIAALQSVIKLFIWMAMGLLFLRLHRNLLTVWREIIQPSIFIMPPMPPIPRWKLILLRFAPRRQSGKRLNTTSSKKNCHGFTIWCSSGKYRSVLSIKKVEEEIEKKCGKKWTWRCWDGWRKK